MRVRRHRRLRMSFGESSDLPGKTDRVAVFEPEFRGDLRHWVRTDSKVALPLMMFAEDGLGKPEPLKYELAGAWSRRITKEHRLVYRVYADRIAFLAARYHY